MGLSQLSVSSEVVQHWVGPRRPQHNSTGSCSNMQWSSARTRTNINCSRTSDDTPAERGDLGWEVVHLAVVQCFCCSYKLCPRARNHIKRFFAGAAVRSWWWLRRAFCLNSGKSGNLKQRSALNALLRFLAGRERGVTSRFEVGTRLTSKFKLSVDLAAFTSGKLEHRKIA